MRWPFGSQGEPHKASSPPDTPDDSLLIERSRKGDSAAFGVLYERYLNRVYRYIAYRTSNTGVAEDLTSEVFLNAWKSIGRYEDRGYAFSTWLLRLAHNEVTDYYRTRGNEVALPETEQQTPSSNTGPDSLLELQTDQHTLLRAVQQLPEEWKQVLLLRFVEELPFDDIAALLKKSSGACRVIQHRALARLRDLLKSEGDLP